MKILNLKKFTAFLIIVSMLLTFIPAPKAQAYVNPVVVDMLTVDNFAALAATGVSSPIAGTILNNGDLGINAGCTDFPAPCTTPGAGGTVNNGTIQNENGVATTGQTDATAVVNDLNGRTPDDTLVPQLGGLTLQQGVYEVSAAATNLTGTLTLTGNADSIFIFQMTSTLITDAASSVVLTGGVQACNVFWTVGTAATFNDDTEFVGTVIAGTDVTFPGGGATLDGRAIAQTAAITFNNTTVNNTSCAAAAAAALASSDDSSGSNTGPNSEERCVATTPLTPQWASRSPAEGGVNLLWSAVGGRLVDIEITNSEGVYEYRYTGVPNTGHMFLPNVTSSQGIRIRVFNECEAGEWLIVSTAPGLPNTGLAPYVEDNISWYTRVGAFVFSSFLLKHY